MSRRADHMLALVIGKNGSQSNPVCRTKSTVSAPKQNHPMTTTAIEKLWSRSYDFKNFPAIFDFQNEYSNSTQSAQEICLAKFKVSSPKDKRRCTRPSLICYETIQSSDEDIDCGKKKFDDSDDSVQDKDYVPPQLQQHKNADSDSEAENSSAQILVQADVHGFPKQVKQNQNTEEIVEQSLEVSENDAVRDCTSLESDDKISLFEDSDDSVKDKDYLPEHPENTSSSYNSDAHNTSGPMIIQADVHFDNNPVNNKNISSKTTTEIMVAHRDENENYDEIITEYTEIETEIEEEIPENEKGYTKSGMPRKRRKIDESTLERKKKKTEIEEEKLSLKPPCDETCRQKCRNKFTEEKRKEIHDQYVKLNWESRGIFIKGMVEPRNIKCRTTGDTNDSTKKKVSYFYYFLTNNEKLQVCKTFFLTTLGYNAKNDRRIHLALHKDVSNQKDKRGSYKRKNVIDQNVIMEHINSFEPSISHHRRAHAPDRLYLPSDLNQTLLFTCFKEKYPNMKVSAETYRKVLKDMNISFANLGHEECEQCVLSKQHFESNECGPGCKKCNEYHTHTLNYTQSRQEYQDDVKKASNETECIFYSVDLQKVIMLPRMDQFKSAIFCHRIVAFNESFIPLGPTSNDRMPFAAIWNESISGRNREDIISTFKAFLKNKRDVKSIVFWVDNCSAQNKNWAFLCFLVNIINSDVIAADEIVIKYFEPGHSFMSADQFHHQVELSMKKMKKVYDFKDFIDAVQMSNSKKTIVKVMDVSDFYNYQDVASQHMLRNQKPRIFLKDIVCIKAKRGNFYLRYKTRYDTPWEVLNFLQLKIQKNKTFPVAPSKTRPAGVAIKRKLEIISKLVPLMPETRREFWKNLPVSISETSDQPNN